MPDVRRLAKKKGTFIRADDERKTRHTGARTVTDFESELYLPQRCQRKKYSCVLYLIRSFKLWTEQIDPKTTRPDPNALILMWDKVF